MSSGCVGGFMGCAALVAGMLAAPVWAQAAAPPPHIVAAPHPASDRPTTEQIMDNSRRLAGLTREEDCRAEAQRSADIIVCGSRRNDQALPVPDIYGPVPGSSDGSAVDPHGVPCGASISNQCYGGINLLVAIAGTVKLIGLLVDPDRNLGEGDPIPERFRGANH